MTRTGKRVRVSVPTSSGGFVDVFTGTLEPGTPWAMWNRVRPDDEAFDLPPMFRVEFLGETDDV